jgi:hypothetical protein
MVARRAPNGCFLAMEEEGASRAWRIVTEVKLSPRHVPFRYRKTFYLNKFSISLSKKDVSLSILFSVYNT